MVNNTYSSVTVYLCISNFKVMENEEQVKFWEAVMSYHSIGSQKATLKRLQANKKVYETENDRLVKIQALKNLLNL